MEFYSKTYKEVILFLVMEAKTIKDIDENTWTTFKSYAAKNNIKLGNFFKTLVEEHKMNTEKFWEEILFGEKIITENNFSLLL